MLDTYYLTFCEWLATQVCSVVLYGVVLYSVVLYSVVLYGVVYTVWCTWYGVHGMTYIVWCMQCGVVYTEW